MGWEVDIGEDKALAALLLLKCKAMAEVTLSVKNQVVIPLEVRTALGLKPGDKLLFVIRAGRVIAVEKPVAHHATLRGLSKEAYPTGYLQKERKSWE